MVLDKIVEYIILLNAEMSKTLAQYLPKIGIINIFVANPLIILIAFFLIIGGIVIFFDFFVDSWKVPFAMLVDIIDVMAIAAPGSLDIIAAGGAILIFMILVHEPKWAKYSFAGAGAIKCVAPIPGLALIPINTILMLIATVID